MLSPVRSPVAARRRPLFPLSLLLSLSSFSPGNSTPFVALPASFPLHRHGCCGKLLRVVPYVSSLPLLRLCILCLFHHDIAVQSVRASRSLMSHFYWRTNEKPLLTSFNTLRVRYQGLTLCSVPEHLGRPNDDQLLHGITTHRVDNTFVF